MLPSSHLVPIYELRPPAGQACEAIPLLLADAFSEFIAASAKLEASYRDLQVEVALLGSELAKHKRAEAERDGGRRAVALAEIAATLVHEIRNPLTSLELFVGLLEEEPARTPEWTAHLRAGLRSLSGTVNNVLAFHGVSAPRLHPVSLSSEVARIVEFVRPLAEQGGLRFSFRGTAEAGEDMAGMVMANPAALQQLLLNLVMNAVRHTEAPGEITVAVERIDEKQMRLSVADTGCGIAAEHLPLLWEPGWSVRGESSGLGLAICRRIAAQHGTVVHVQSKLGEGTEFSMEMPCL